MKWTARILVVLALLAEALVLFFGLRHRFFAGTWEGGLFVTESVAVVLFCVAVLALSRCGFPARQALLLVVGAGLLLELLALSTPPTTSDDVNRYAWDAKVQLAGIDPYRYTPSAPELDRLRGTFLFTPGNPSCVWKLPDGRCSKVNRPDVHTIYPPVAEGAFDAARLASLGRSDGPFPLQVLAVLGVLALTLLLAGGRRLTGGRPGRWRCGPGAR